LQGKNALWDFHQHESAFLRGLDYSLAIEKTVGSSIELLILLRSFLPFACDLTAWILTLERGLSNVSFLNSGDGIWAKLLLLEWAEISLRAGLMGPRASKEIATLMNFTQIQEIHNDATLIMSKYFLAQGKSVRVEELLKDLKNKNLTDLHRVRKDQLNTLLYLQTGKLNRR